MQRTADNGEESYLTVAEVAEQLQLNPATIRMWISKGQLPATRPGQRKLLIRRSDLDRKLASPAPRPRAWSTGRIAALEHRLDTIEALLVRIAERLGVDVGNLDRPPPSPVDGRVE